MTLKTLPSELLERGWCQKHFAEDWHGMECSYDGDSACKWCITGAALGVLNSTDFERFVREASLISAHEKNLVLWQWNDDPARTQAEVVAVAREAERRMGLVKDA